MFTVKDVWILFFFFQAEDGIRDIGVTGVQTCALPICAVAAGEASLRRGPDLLPALREAGVVDAGGYGVIVILAGVVAAPRGDAAPALEHHAPARISHPEHSS